MIGFEYNIMQGTEYSVSLSLSRQYEEHLMPMGNRAELPCTTVCE